MTRSPRYRRQREQVWRRHHSTWRSDGRVCDSLKPSKDPPQHPSCWTWPRSAQFLSAKMLSGCPPWAPHRSRLTALRGEVTRHHDPIWRPLSKIGELAGEKPARHDVCSDHHTREHRQLQDGDALHAPDRSQCCERVRAFTSPGPRVRASNADAQAVPVTRLCCVRRACRSRLRGLPP